MKYRKKPVVIEAMQYDGLNAVQILGWAKFPQIAEALEGGLAIETREGVMRAAVGDWIIKGVKGEFYPCKPDIFEATYGPADVTNLLVARAALAKPLERILVLANGLSTRLRGTPDVYEANKIMHEVWDIQKALAPHAAPTSACGVKGCTLSAMHGDEPHSWEHGA